MIHKYKTFLFLLLAFALSGAITACSDDDDLPNGGQPRIEYVRVTNPDASDSLIATAGQGAMVVIMGENLQDAREVWFNDRRGELSPTFITNTSIITRVPSDIPMDITNTLRLKFANGDSIVHDFEVDISEPLLLSMVSEYVPAGEVATIRGNYFYEPITVTFTGGVVGEVVGISADNRLVDVMVPEGAEPGPITVASNFGETESEFWFRDNRNIIAGFEETDFSGWWSGKDFIVESDPDISPVNNKFIRINQEKGAWSWLEFWVGNGGTIVEATKNIPADAFVKPENYSLNFEINTLGSLTGAEVRMYMGNSADFGAARQNIYYTWKPYLDTEGEWQTVRIPFEDFLEANTDLEYNPDGYTVSFYFSSPVATHPNIGLDNMRVVPKANN